MIPVPPAIQRFPWKLMALLSAITGFGLLVLYSAAGGSFTPWALQQGVRFLVFLTLALAISGRTEAPPVQLPHERVLIG